MRRLLVDFSYICWRSFHSVGRKFSSEDIRPILTFGVLKDLIHIMDRWQTSDLVFCLDSPSSKRKEICPVYKSNREPLDDGSEADLKYKEASSQMRLMEREILPAIGFRNLFRADGFEADDLIAILSKQEGRSVIVSSDSDLLQLLRRGVVVYRPDKDMVITRKRFKRQHGISPAQWVDVKAIAGCSSDNVIGVPGIGEKRAIQYLTGTLSAKMSQKIKEHGPHIEHNRQLVKLPLPGLECPTLNENELSQSKWQAVAKEWKLSTLLRRFEIFN